MHRWLPQALVIVLAVTPVYADEQVQAPQAPPVQTAPPAHPPAPTVPQATPMAPLPIVKDLKIIALSGQDQMNDLERKIMAPLVVQVLDQNDRPVEGAEVVFRFPLNGPGAIFRSGKNSQTERSNGTGEAAATHWMANNQVGSFEVHVTATYGNENGETTIRMSNVTRIVDETATGRAKHASWHSSTWVKVALVVGAAGAAAGIFLAVHGGGHAASSASTVTITPGPPSVGGPH